MRTLLALLAVVMFPLTGCGERPADATEGVAARAESAPASATGRVFEREQVGGKPCTLLTPQQLAAIAGVDASRITESPAMRCLFSWDDDSVVVQATVHRSQDAAQRYFEGLTADVTAEQMAEQKRALQEHLSRKAGETDAAPERTAVQGALVSAIPETDVTNEAIAGVGDEASVSDEGKVTVRIGNLIFKVAAQRGSDGAADAALAREVAVRVAENLRAL